MPVSIVFIRRALFLVLITVVVVQGCRRKPAIPPLNEPPAEVSPTPATQSSPPKQPAGTAPAASSKEAVPDRLPTAPNDSSLRFPIHQELTGAVHLYLMDNQKMPPDFDTLVKGKYLKAMPKPPPGKRFALDRNRMQVVIMD